MNLVWAFSLTQICMKGTNNFVNFFDYFVIFFLSFILLYFITMQVSIKFSSMHHILTVKL